MDGAAGSRRAEAVQSCAVQSGRRRCTALHRTTPQLCTTAPAAAPPPQPPQHLPLTGTGRAAGCSRVRQQLVLYRAPGQAFPRSARFKVNGQACGGPGGRLNALPFTGKPAARTHWGARSAHCTSALHRRPPTRTTSSPLRGPCTKVLYSAAFTPQSFGFSQNYFCAFAQTGLHQGRSWVRIRET